MKLLYSFQQLRETVSNFCQKELAPYADQIDKENIQIVTLIIL